ncbi:unnamed protein product [Chondrus crispus]|uniref:Uncharacterized protein n=1 Tax=Chondrus crispus TaxID=2769 RepID=R7QJA2_CHOCR|nr:unnamed protein product [Chondrus crispus]CDF38179.1 unnamed protein product [Chondrus crispus]|eukprot:XP_005718048.1 unnamed protein product [Chondrus crispus]
MQHSALPQMNDAERNEAASAASIADTAPPSVENHCASTDAPGTDSTQKDGRVAQGEASKLQKLRRSKLEWLQRQKSFDTGMEGTASALVRPLSVTTTEESGPGPSEEATPRASQDRVLTNPASRGSALQKRPTRERQQKACRALERKLKGARKRASNAAAEAANGSPAALKSLPKLQKAVEKRTRQLHEARHQNSGEEPANVNSNRTSDGDDKLTRRKGAETMKSEGEVVLGKSNASSTTPPILQPGTAGNSSKRSFPGEQVQRTRNSSSRAGANTSLSLRSDPHMDSVTRLTTLHKELENAVGLWAGGVNKGGMQRVRFQQDGEENDWAFVDDGDIKDFNDRIPEMALRFPFELDDFQKRAILHVEQRNSVFVAAHTSAGKTVVAEYAIALAAELGSKVFYTSPIKTLSNQKLRDFRGKFKDVGLVTGDVSINDDAQCVIMTTEILRSMLYRGADVIRDLMFVIFDEVQFLNDEERGVVWEESIIMLPPHVSIIMLSATVPNALEFASWVGKTKERKVAVVSSPKRPVPLQHAWLHRKAGDPNEVTEAVLLHEGGSFLMNNYVAALRSCKMKDSREQKAKKSKSKSASTKKARMSVEQAKDEKTKDGAGQDHKLTEKEAHDSLRIEGNHVVWGRKDAAETNGMNEATQGAEQGDQAEERRTGKMATKGAYRNKEKRMDLRNEGQGRNRLPSIWTPLVRFLDKADRTPTVVFCFSKKKCEVAVESLEHSDLLPNTADKAFVHQFFNKSITSLREEDRALPQVERVRANLMRGISSHHAGLLPLIKEITEILFSKGLVKVLFATETFAMGVNMPARTVVFAAIRKHDGRRFRYLESGEYTQMSGRAGRRGLDAVGHVYLFFPPDERFPDVNQLRKVMTGTPISLASAFRLTYNMILNVLRVDEMRVEEIMKQSFSEAGMGDKAKDIALVLADAGSALGKLALSTTGNKPTMQQDTKDKNGDGTLQVYVAKFSEYYELSQKMFREANYRYLFQRAIVPGRLVIVEVQPGLLSLATVYSIPGSTKRSGSARRSRRITQDSAVWVAALTGVAKSRHAANPKSVLFIPELQPLPDSTVNHPQICTSDGLVVMLVEIIASKILYICNECDPLITTARVDEQDRASTRWYFSRKRAHDEGQRVNKWMWNSAKKTLHANAVYVQMVVSRWRRKERSANVQAADCFPVEMFCVGTGSGMEPGDAGYTSLVEEQVNLRTHFIELVTDRRFGKAVTACVREDGSVRRIERMVLEEKISRQMRALRTASDEGNEPSLLPEYLKRSEVLQKLNYVDTDGLGVKMKGRCACEVSTADSVVLTEILLDGVLDGLEESEICSLLSSLVCRKKNASGIHDGDEKRYSEKYCEAKDKMREIVRKVGKVQEECGVALEFDIANGGDDYEAAICRWDLAQAVYEWARGKPFFSLMSLTEQQEGDVVVCVKRLCELLRDAQKVAKGIGNEDLEHVLEEAVSCIRRDVIFNGSLYYESATGRAEGEGAPEGEGRG